MSRNGSSIIAFSIGAAYKPGNGVAMIAGHIDSNTVKVKPVSANPERAGFVQLGVAPYASGHSETWWDRELGIGGRVIVHDPDTGKTSARLVKLDWPVAKVATLAEHFGIGFFGDANKETRMVPILGLASSYDDIDHEPLGGHGSFAHAQPPMLVKIISEELDIRPHQIQNWELELFDFQPAQVFGLGRELISAGRLDDKLCSWSALMGLRSCPSFPAMWWSVAMRRARHFRYPRGSTSRPGGFR